MVYKWYILPIGGLYGTYHLLREPGNSIDLFPGLISHVYIYIYTGTCLSSILGFQPSKKKAFCNEHRGHLGSRYIYIYVYRANYIPKV